MSESIFAKIYKPISNQGKTFKLKLAGAGLVVVLALLWFTGVFAHFYVAAVNIETSFSGYTTAANTPGSTVVFTNDQTGYIFYSNGSHYCRYRKTTNGGTSWASSVALYNSAGCTNVAVWYDRWTPGDTTGNLIHVIVKDGSTEDEDLYYLSLDTSNDTLSTAANLTTTPGVDKTNTFSHGTSSRPNISKGTDGDIYAGVADGDTSTTSYILKCSTTCSTASNWSEITPSGMPQDEDDDYILMPQASGNMLLIVFDSANDDILSKVYTDSTNTWDANWAVVDNAATDPTSGSQGGTIGATINRSTYEIYLAYIADVQTYGTNDDIRTAKYSSGSWTGGTNVVTDSSCAGVSDCGVVSVKLAYDETNDEIYALYIARSTPATATTARVYWKKSTNGLSSWSAESSPLDGAADELEGPSMNLMSDERLYATWIDRTNTDVYGATVADITIAPTPTPTPTPTPDPSETVTFAAAGDFGNDRTDPSNANDVFRGIGAEQPDFALGLGDFIYSNDTTNIAPWCANVKSQITTGSGVSGFGDTFPFQLVAGNHDTGESNTNIMTITDSLRDCLPNRINNITEGTAINGSAYGLEYYYDYPDTTDPIVRVILTSPDLFSWSYAEGTDNYNFVKNAILDARDDERPNGAIPWIVVGMHKNCITNGGKSCEINQGFFNMLLGKNLGPGGTGYGEPVDLILEGHEHTYHRSKHLSTNALTCASIAVGSYDADCVTNSGGSFTKGEGGILAIVGTGGVGTRSINSAADAETPYFEAWNAANESMPAGNAGALGFGKFTATATQLQGEFISTNGVNYSDTFTITKSETPPTPTPTITITTKNPVADSHVRQSSPTTNYGTSTTLSVDGSPIDITFIKFDLTDLASNVSNAILRVFVEESSAASQKFTLVSDSSWLEAALNWNNQPARSTELGIQPDPNTNEFTEIDVTSAVNANKGSLLTIAIENIDGENSSDGIDITSREGGANQPQLVLTSQDIEPTPTPILEKIKKSIKGGVKIQGGTKID